jgi:hypothetical protein
MKLSPAKLDWNSQDRGAPNGQGFWPAHESENKDRLNVMASFSNRGCALFE